MGLEIVTLAITLYVSIVRKTDKVAKNKLKRDVIVFCSIGIVVTMLGFIYCAFFSCDTPPANLKLNDIYYILKYSYYVLFALYAIMSCLSHIKYPYILGRIEYSNMKEIDKK